MICLTAIRVGPRDGSSLLTSTDEQAITADLHARSHAKYSYISPVLGKAAMNLSIMQFNELYDGCAMLYLFNGKAAEKCNERQLSFAFI